MAVKVVRQPNKIALLGVPTSAAAMSAGHEAAPSALRTAGLIERLKSIGYEVTDLGDDPAQVYKPDQESPRARNLAGVIAVVEALKPRVELAIKSGALPLILSGDCSVALATVAGARRYFRTVSLIYVDRDADINVPATTPSGCVDGMVVAHLTGRGAAELVRFWGEPPLVREPDLALFGTDRIDPSEEEALERSTLRRYGAAHVKRMGAAAAARIALERTHSNGHEFVLHFDVDVIADFRATNYPGSGGLTLDEVREALEVFALEKNLAAIEVTAYNPAKDPDGSGAKIIIDLLAGILEKRLEAFKAAAPVASAEEAAAKPLPTAPAATSGEPVSEPEAETSTASEAPAPPAAPGEAWSSDSLADESAATEELPEGASESGESPS
ncbi:MAG TPA: arginase family protein [Candidatus Acidoferrales bacterium]|nr:arginase family protein [Candidatus Acidoferrales bacterium]